ncbi:MAG: DUF4198 domain-containing protein [Planctomycetaceae bacterium]|nr:DUF4198 domain-containing protein [Planctomycetaceae bacterium]
MIRFGFAVFAVLNVTVASAHDTWVQTNGNIVRTRDAVYVDLMLGNHGNDHRDFKQAGKVQLDPCTLDVIDPSGKTYDLKPAAIDTGYTPSEGHWSAKFVPTVPGLYTVSHKVESKYLTTRSIKSGKCYFVADENLDKVPAATVGFDRRLGHALELTLESHPVTPMGPGQAIKVRVFYKDHPAVGFRVSFIPRGVTLAEGFDEKFERTTDDEGRASFTPLEGNYYLIAAHREEPKESGDGFDKTKYCATICIHVPEMCACCH